MKIPSFLTHAIVAGTLGAMHATSAGSPAVDNLTQRTCERLSMNLGLDCSRSRIHAKHPLPALPDFDSFHMRDRPFMRGDEEIVATAKERLQFLLPDGAYYQKGVFYWNLSGESSDKTNYHAGGMWRFGVKIREGHYSILFEARSSR